MSSSKGFLVWLAGLSMLGFLATDMYLPAFSAIQQDTGARPGVISASLSVFLGGFALGQLIWGPLSDRVGRRPVLLAGLLIFAFGCAGMLLVTTPGMLLFLRFIQATGVCATAVSWQALVADNYPASAANRIFATIMPLVALSPALAPLAGSALLSHFDWQAIFFVLLMISLLLIAPLWRFTRSGPQTWQTDTPTVSYLTLLGHRGYCGNVLLYGACSASFFAWLTGSPFILSTLGYGPQAIGLSYVPQTLAFLLGGYGCRAALKKWQGNQLLPGLLILFAASIVVTFGVSLLPAPSLGGLLLPFCLMALANGAIYPVVVAQALRPFPQAAGKAAALQNTLQLGLCFVASLLVSVFVASPLLATTGVMLSTLVVVGIGYLLQRAPRTDPAEPTSQATSPAHECH